MRQPPPSVTTSRQRSASSSSTPTPRLRSWPSYCVGVARSSQKVPTDAYEALLAKVHGFAAHKCKHCPTPVICLQRNSTKQPGRCGHEARKSRRFFNDCYGARRQCRLLGTNLVDAKRNQPYPLLANSRYSNSGENRDRQYLSSLSQVLILHVNPPLGISRLFRGRGSGWGSCLGRLSTAHIITMLAAAGIRTKCRSPNCHRRAAIIGNDAASM